MSGTEFTAVLSTAKPQVASKLDASDVEIILDCLRELIPGADGPMPNIDPADHYLRKYESEVAFMCSLRSPGADKRDRVRTCTISTRAVRSLMRSVPQAAPSPTVCDRSHWLAVM